MYANKNSFHAGSVDHLYVSVIYFILLREHTGNYT